MAALRRIQRVSRRLRIHLLPVMLLGTLLIGLYLRNSTVNVCIPEVVEENAKSSEISHTQCQKSMSVVAIPGFNNLTPSMQNFMHYRHCRHFPMLLDVPDKCGGANNPEEVFLLLVIKSSPMNYEHREVIRKTWGEERLYKGRKICRVFLIGKVDKDDIRRKHLQLEQELYNDILQWDFIDSFYNLTLKQVLFFEWFYRNCDHVRFMINCDDDILANTDGIVDYLNSLSNNDGRSHLCSGYLLNNTAPIRPPGGKYAVPVQVYEPKLYPPYCTGGGYILSGYTALVIHMMSDSVQLIPIDDAFIGMCLARANLKPTRQSGFWISGIPRNILNDPCKVREKILAHPYKPEEQHMLWKKMHDPNLICDTESKQ